MVSCFPARGELGTPFNGWSKSMGAFRKACGVDDFTLHDLRRTAATIMAEELQVLPHVIERLLNHVTGTISPIGKIYNRAKYLPEIRTALLTYEKFLLSLVGPCGDNSPAAFVTPDTLPICQPQTDTVRHSPPQSATGGHSPTESDTVGQLFTLDVHQTQALFDAAGLPRSLRSIARYCQTKRLDAVTVDGPNGPE